MGATIIVRDFISRKNVPEIGSPCSLDPGRRRNEVRAIFNECRTGIGKMYSKLSLPDTSVSAQNTPKPLAAGLLSGPLRSFSAPTVHTVAVNVVASRSDTGNRHWYKQFAPRYYWVGPSWSFLTVWRSQAITQSRGRTVRYGSNNAFILETADLSGELLVYPSD